MVLDRVLGGDGTEDDLVDGAVQAASARLMPSAEVAAMAVSTGFTPMRTKWAWYAGIES